MFRRSADAIARWSLWQANYRHDRNPRHEAFKRSGRRLRCSGVNWFYGTFVVHCASFVIIGLENNPSQNELLIDLFGAQ